MKVAVTVSITVTKTSTLSEVRRDGKLLFGRSNEAGYYLVCYRFLF